MRLVPAEVEFLRLKVEVDATELLRGSRVHLGDCSRSLDGEPGERGGVLRLAIDDLANRGEVYETVTARLYLPWVAVKFKHEGEEVFSIFTDLHDNDRGILTAQQSFRVLNTEGRQVRIFTLIGVALPADD